MSAVHSVPARRHQPTVSRARELGPRQAVLVAVLLLLVMAMPANAQTPADGMHEPQLLVAEDALKQDAAEYARQFDVTADEAIQRLAMLPQMAETLALLETSNPDRFAGGWAEHEEAFGLVVRFTGEDVGLALAHEALARLDAPVEMRFGREHTLAALYAGQARIERTIDKSYPQMGMYVDVKTGSVVLLGPDAVGPDQLADLSTEARVPVAVEFSPPYEVGVGSGGRPIDTQLGGCTTGFTSVDAVSGETGVLTAGHCAGSVGSLATYHDTDGTFDSVEMRGKRWDSNQDFAWYRTPGLDAAQFQSGFGYRNVTGTILRTQMVGGHVCHFGRTTGYSCGIVDTIRYDPPDSACNNTPCSDRWAAVINDANIKCAGGDSGGPYFNGNTAWGTHQGSINSGPGYGQCTVAGFMSAEQLTWDGVNTRIMLCGC